MPASLIYSHLPAKLLGHALEATCQFTRNLKGIQIYDWASSSLAIETYWQILSSYWITDNMLPSNTL